MDAFTIAWVTVALIIVALLAFVLVSGERVGSIECQRAGFLSTSGKVKLLVKRQAARGSALPQVQLQLRAIAMVQAFTYPQRDAMQLAQLLEDAARQVDAR